MLTYSAIDCAIDCAIDNKVADPLTFCLIGRHMPRRQTRAAAARYLGCGLGLGDLHSPMLRQVRGNRHESG